MTLVIIVLIQAGFLAGINALRFAEKREGNSEVPHHEAKHPALKKC
jgi:hypothetical protein